MSHEEIYLQQLRDRVRSYAPVSDEAFNLLRDIARVEHLERNEVLLHMGQVSRAIHFVCKGAIIAYFTDAEGNSYNKSIFLENNFAGSTVSALLKAPSEFTLQAIEDTTMLTMNYAEYRQLIFSNDEWKDFYIAYLERNWVIDKEQREIALVMDTAKVRYQRLLEAYPDIDKRIPLQHIASNLGITPTQLSRIRRELNKI